MFTLGNRRNTEDRSTYEPLLGEPNGNALEDQTIFSVEDEDEDFKEDGSVEETSEEHSNSRHVHFEEEVRVIAPPLRSTLQSRETGALHAVYKSHGTTLMLSNRI